MYVPQTNACGVQNSLTPVSSSAIAASQAILQGMQDLVSNANEAMQYITARPDLNAAGQPLAVVVDPTTGVATIAPASAQPVLSFDTAPTPPAVSQMLQRWPKMCTGRSVSEGLPSPRSCNIIPPMAPPMPPLTLPPVGVAATPQPPTPAPTGFTPPTTGNVCIDIQKGYVQQTQVSPQQLAACSEKGYYLMGTRILDPVLALQLAQYFNANVGKLPMIPDQPNVPAYNPSMGLAGVSRGLGQMVSAYRRRVR